MTSRPEAQLGSPSGSGQVGAQRSATGVESPQLRVALVIRSLAPGGAERQFVLLARLLRARGHHVCVFVFYGGGALEGEVIRSGVTVVVPGKSHRWDVIGFISRLARALRQFRPDVIHTYGPVPNMVGVALRPLVGMVHVVWGVRSAELDWSRYERIVKYSHRASAWLSRGAWAILVNSEAGIRYHRSLGYPSRLMRFVPNGIDLQTFRPDPAGGAALRTMLGLSGTVIGIVGRLDPIKDHDTFLRAARRYLDGGGSARFLIVGGGSADYAQWLSGRVRELKLEPAVVIAGHREDLPAVYSAMDVHTLTSRGEGTPNAVGEAMACGVACVVTDVGDAAGMVAGTGRVIPPGDPAALADAWTSLLAVDPESRAEAARRRVAERYSVEQLLNSTEAALIEASGKP